MFHRSPYAFYVTWLFSLLALWACTNGRFTGSGGSGGGGGGGGSGVAAGFPDDDVLAIAINSANGDVYIGGEFNQVGSITVNHIARFFSDGSLDTAFTKGSGFDDDVYTLLLTNDQLYVGGDFTSYNGLGGARLIRLQLDGSFDTGYNLLNHRFLGQVNKVKPTSNPVNALWVGGDMTAYGDGTTDVVTLKIARMRTNGILDTGFNGITTGFDGPVNDLSQTLIGPTFQLLVIGEFTLYNLAPSRRVAQLLTSGAIDAGFTSTTGLDNTPFAVERLDTNSFVVVGDFENYGVLPSQRAVGLRTDGAGTRLAASGANDTIRALAPYPGGTYIAGGDFTSFELFSPQKIVQFGIALAPVTSFVTNGGFDNDVLSVAVEAAGKVYAGGKFSTFNAVTATRLARLNADGTLDTSFPQRP